MNRQRPALRVALLAVAAALSGFAIIASFLGWQANGYINARHRASAVAAGTVTEDGIGDSGNIRVRWADSVGHEHVQRFAIYDTERYTNGRAFPVSYNPANPAENGFPGDQAETSAEDDLEVPIELVGIATAGLILAWVLRGVLFRWAGRRPARPMVGVPLAGQFAGPKGPIFFGNSTWFALADPATSRRPFRWQRVMWHPAIDSKVGSVNVVVHGDAHSSRRLVVELPDGTLLVPIGRLRRRPPKRVLLRRRSDARTDRKDSFILPGTIAAALSQRWWYRGLVFALVGAGIGVAMGLRIGGGGIAILPFAVAASAFLVNGWALTATES